MIEEQSAPQGDRPAIASSPGAPLPMSDQLASTKLAPAANTPLRPAASETVVTAPTSGILAPGVSDYSSSLGHLGRYELRRKLGSGAFGVVYLAYDPALQRDVAIKMPHADVVAKIGGAAEYVREAQALAKLRHEAIVSVYDLGQLDDGRCFMVTEFIDGETLEQRLKRIGTLPPREAAALMARVADGLQHAHERGFVHRDLKPANILLDRKDQPHIADFGLALHESVQSSRAGEVAGTLAYMAPEQLQGAAHHLDGRSDLWACGVMLYEMLTGRRPFDGKSFREFAAEITERPAKPLRQFNAALPASLEQITLKCLEKSVTARFTTAHDLAQELRKAASELQAHLAQGKPRKQIAAAVGCLGMTFTATLAMSLLALSTRNFLEGEMAATHLPSAMPGDPSPPTKSIDFPGPVTSLEPSSFDNHPVFTVIDSSREEITVRVGHYRIHEQQSIFLGDITDQSPHPERGDALRVDVVLDHPSFCYLIAFNPDGTFQLCDPASPDEWPKRDFRIWFPRNIEDAFFLTDGSGQQAFVVIASPLPLPPFAEWLAEHQSEVPWKPMESGIVNDGGARSHGERLRDLDRYLRSQWPAAAVQTIGIPVAEPPP